MATWQNETSLWLWLMSTVISFVCFVISTCIFYRERQKRQQPDHLIVSKHLSISSYLCIALCPITTLFHIISYLPSLCYIQDILGGPVINLQISAMEYYQLSRLYYCFSRKQIQSKVGYPNWVFVLLFSLVVIWYFFANTMGYSLLTTDCQITSDGTVILEYTELYDKSSYIFILTIYSTVWTVIEFTTAALYWYKIHSLQRHRNEKDREIYDRIQSILHRVLILTFFYLIIGMLLIMLIRADLISVGKRFIGDIPFEGWAYSLNELSFSYSMFLMQDHNTSEYIAFLRFIKRYKCIWCFCCFGPMVNEQYRMLVDNVDTRTFEKKKSIQTANTRNPSADVEYGNKANGMELSIATKTVCNTDDIVLAEE